MKSLILICLSLVFSISIKAQQLSVDDIPQLVTIIDQQLDLNSTQEKELIKIFSESLLELQRIQLLRIVDIEKLELIEKNQNLTRSKLEVVLMPDQYTAYVEFLDGTNSVVDTTPITSNEGNQPPPPSSTNTTSSSNSAIALADQLGFSSTKKTEFVMVYENQEKVIKDIVSAGVFNEATSVDLLTTVLVTDFKIIDLGGKSTYEKYFQLRQSGALSQNGSASNQDVDINQVYTFYDIKEGLELSDAQTDSFIRLFLENEIEKKNIREQNKGNGGEINKKLKALEKETLVKLQKFLSDKQVQALVQMIGG